MNAITSVTWLPSFEIAFSILLVPRLISAFMNQIADCDETYNYWEPLHYLVYGFGFQTWEYSPDYALRSYLYLLFHEVFVKFATLCAYFIGTGFVNVGAKITIFYGTRGCLALFSAYSEACFYSACATAYGYQTGRYLLVFLTLNAGIFHASTAFLPSTFTMYLVMLLTSSWILNQTNRAIFYGIVAVVSGWPYVGALFVPFFIDTIGTQGILSSLIPGVIIGVLVTGLELLVNYYYYQQIVLPAWNIIKYNVLSGNHNATLYGTEPPMFYIKNLLLKFNILLPLGFLGGVAAFYLPSTPCTSSKSRRVAYLSPLYIWIIIMFSQPHKEERFLFPVYPLLCLAAATTFSTVDIRIEKWCCLTSYANVLTSVWKMSIYSTIILYTVLSISHITSNVLNYSAPINVFTHLYQSVLPKENEQTSNYTHQAAICMGKDWYFYPSSFFLPNNSTNLAFVDAGFHGQLPKHFDTHSNGTSIIPTHMNDKNAEETSRYVPISQCDLFIDISLPNNPVDILRNDSEKWVLLYSEPMLNASASKAGFRSFFFPGISPKFLYFSNFAVYKRESDNRW